MKVNINMLEKCLKRDIDACLVPMVCSSPGLGKSDLIRQIAAQANLQVIDLRLSQCEPIDLMGYPASVNNRMVFNTPEYLPLEHDPLPAGKNGWLLFLDEFNSGSKATEAAAYKLILDRAVYKYKLHPKCRIVCAGNLITDGAIVNNLSTATMSRLTHYTLTVSVNDWTDWAIKNNIDQRIISFIGFKPNMLHNFNKNTSELTFPCPRTWTFADRILKGRKATKEVDIFDNTMETPIDDVDVFRLQGVVGEGAAAEFCAYVDVYKKLPTIKNILDNPSGFKMNSREPSVMYALTTLIAYNMNVNTIEKLAIAVDRLDEEFKVVALRTAVRLNPGIEKHPSIKVLASNLGKSLFGGNNGV